MAHIVYIDLSAKVEQWTKASAVAMANDMSRTLWVSSKVKQRTRQLLIERHGSKSIQYRVLAILVYLVVREDLPNIRQIVIDQDYSGSQAEATIKTFLLELLRRDLPNVKARFVRFENVAKSRADVLAKQVFDGKIKPDRTVRFAEIEQVLRKN